MVVKKNVMVNVIQKLKPLIIDIRKKLSKCDVMIFIEHFYILNNTKVLKIKSFKRHKV